MLFWCNDTPLSGVICKPLLYWTIILEGGALLNIVSDPCFVDYQSIGLGDFAVKGV